jgi:polyhydroxybutyrate depolymerase
MRLLNLICLIFSPILTAQSVRETYEYAVKNQVIDALKNDPLQYKSVDRAKEKFMSSVVKKRMSKEIGKIQREPDFDRIITKVSKLKISEPGIKRKPAYIFTPKKYNSQRYYPLIISLHGYSGFSLVQGLFLPFQKWVSKKGFILAVPSGVKDKQKKGFWNATTFCCNFDKKNINDVRYLQRLIGNLKAKYNISKVIIAGHSNGGFLSQRVACEKSQLVDTIITWGGSSFYKYSDCRPKKPVSIIHLHGTEDATIPYDGIPLVLPSAPLIVKRWARKMNCKSEIRDFTIKARGASIKSKEIKFSGYENCNGGKVSILGTIPGGKHAIPPLSSKVYDFILDAVLFNNDDIEDTRVNRKKIRKFY